ncbi:hypothetical protein [Caballeronia sp. LZ016]|uniref:tetratricopeptide repeat protein n=1 Tax=Caballeronia sp. LZ016 TaxID=3038554 RepID=UPI0028652181|nr:hypothetical protein [Caballeronia sp. LZ016]MDR5737155.1 hypothetical protein [Caballeronia sp. LZ016]
MTISAQSNEFVVKRIERDAQQSLQRNADEPQMCWLVLAFVAFLRSDRDRFIRCAEAAYALANYDSMVLGNAASLALNLGATDLAVKYARRLAAMKHGHARMFLAAARALYGATLFEEANAVMHSGNIQHALTESDCFLVEMNDLIASFQRSGVDPQTRMALLQLASSTIRASGHAIRRTRPVRFPDHTVRYEFYIDQSASQCANVNVAIAEALTDEFDDAHPELITFVCRPLASFVPRGTSFEIAR